MQVGRSATYPGDTAGWPMARDFAADHLMWFPERGYGYYPCRAPVYDEAYFRRYAELADTALGRQLTDHRAHLVEHYIGRGTGLLDVGVGCGAFLETMLRRGYVAHGYDINPEAVHWLRNRGLFRDLHAPGDRFDCVTFWDVLEHLPDPRLALRKCRDWVFAALPIFRNAEHVIHSKHYRKDEHFHYWTRHGFIAFADSQGFETLDVTNRETVLGREDIESFVLRRRA